MNALDPKLNAALIVPKQTNFHYRLPLCWYAMSLSSMSASEILTMLSIHRTLSESSRYSVSAVSFSLQLFLVRRSSGKNQTD